MTEVQPRTYPLGVSRPDMAVADLPAPEEVFGVPRIGPRQLVMFVIGPSLIALGISIGSGEWLLGPQAVGQFGFVGVGWVITVSAVLQTFYNVECARYIVATGEVPVVGWGRVPPGKMLWIPLSVFIDHLRVHRGRLGGRPRGRACSRWSTAASPQPRRCSRRAGTRSVCSSWSS